MEIPKNAEHLDVLYSYGLKLVDSLAQDMESAKISEETLSRELSEARFRQKQLRAKLNELLEETF